MRVRIGLVGGGGARLRVGGVTGFYGVSALEPVPLEYNPILDVTTSYGTAAPITAAGPEARRRLRPDDYHDGDDVDDSANNRNGADKHHHNDDHESRASSCLADREHHAGRAQSERASGNHSQNDLRGRMDCESPTAGELHEHPQGQADADL
jgi:hypothetical protein